MQKEWKQKEEQETCLLQTFMDGFNHPLVTCCAVRVRTANISTCPSSEHGWMSDGRHSSSVRRSLLLQCP